MKTLLIIRHAKSDWGNGELHDIERPLADRGIRDAGVMGKLLVKKGVQPDLMVSSPALRAFSTCRIISDLTGYDKNMIRVEQVLYFGTVDDIIQIIEKIEPDVETVCIFGHNPTFSILANKLCKGFEEEMPTCGIVALELISKDSGSLHAGNSKLLWFEYPKKNR
ncbi:MAG: SixA phosphatase family protein [Chitinophagales bacterium]